MNDAQLLHIISDLSREFGSESYVRGGGGNTSCKNQTSLFIKPSGIALSDMTPENFLSLSRAKLAGLYDTAFPVGDAERERAVAAFMAETVAPGFSGRPSVEAPLHNSFPQRFVVHTHPALVNGMTCGANGVETCARLFPDALWLPVVHPGYTLSMHVRDEMRIYEAKHGRAPEVLFLANHGVFIVHDEADGIRTLYRGVMDALAGEVRSAGLGGLPGRGGLPSASTVDALVAAARREMGEDAAFFEVSGPFTIPAAAISPDHIVYCRSHMYEGDLLPATLRAFRDRYGYWPRVVSTPDAVLGFGTSAKVASLALQLVWDGAMVVRYADAFGGIRYLEQPFVDFIENWEVESYRQKVAQ